MNNPSPPHRTEPPDGRILRNIAITIPSGKAPERLDLFLTRQIAELTRSRVQQLMDEGMVRVNGRPAKPSHKVKPGEIIELSVVSRPPLELLPESIPLDIIYEDEWLVVVNKPAGLVVHPAQGNRTGTLVNALLGHYEDLEPSYDPNRPGIVHRLDKETSGLMVVCKRVPALSRLAEDFRRRNIEREYWAIAWWPMPSRRGVIDLKLGRDPHDRKKFAVSESGKEARTRWEQLEKFAYLCLLAIHLETGRTHQIRVHLASIGHPVFGDPDYYGRNRQLGRLSSAQRREVAEYLENVPRQMLHARTLGFRHPVTRREMSFDAPPPDDFNWLLSRLRASQKR